MDLSNYTEPKPHYKKRILWHFVNATLFRWMIGPPLRRLRNGVLRLFGAAIHPTAEVRSTCQIFAPWNLTVGAYSTIGPHTELYNKDTITIGAHCVVSQHARLYTASHDITQTSFGLVTAPIILEDKSWIAADAFVGMGVRIGEGAVIGARAAVFKEVPAWTVVGGNPAKVIKKRMLI